MKNQLVQNITLCFTMGGRPDLLEKSIDSIQEKWDFPHIIAVNDFSDSVCDEIFKRKFPDGVLLSDGQNVGTMVQLIGSIKISKPPIFSIQKMIGHFQNLLTLNP